MSRDLQAATPSPAERARSTSRLLNGDRLKAVLATAGLDAIVATAPENVTYASGYWALSQWIRRGPQTYVLVPADDISQACIVAATSLLDLIADQDVWVTSIRRFGYFHTDRRNGPLDGLDRRQEELYALPDDKDPLAALVKAVNDAGLADGRIAIDETGLRHGDWEHLREALPRANLQPGFELWRRVRAVKTPIEIDRLRKVAHLTERSIEAALTVAGEGATEIDLARAFHIRTIQEGGFPVLGCIGFGARGAMPNVQPSGARLRRGDVIRFDVGGRYDHYRADVARIAVFGEPDPRVAAYYRALHAGARAAIDAIRPGARAADLFALAVDTVQREGIPHYNRSHVGHGIGIDGYDLPDLSPMSNAVLEEGMVVCVETPYYELGWCGLQVEDMVVVRADGTESLMTTDGNLMIVS